MGESPINLITTPAQDMNSNATRRVGTNVLRYTTYVCLNVLVEKKW